MDTTAHFELQHPSLPPRAYVHLPLRTPPEQLWYYAETRPNDVFLRQPIGGHWLTHTWSEAADEVLRIAAALKSMRWPTGSKVAILSKNTAHWMLADLAIMAAGYVSVPLYPTLTPDTLHRILVHSEAKGIFLGKLDSFERMKVGIPATVHAISMPHYEHSGYQQWRDLLVRFEPLAQKPTPSLDELMTIIYTSGTTGDPKGVMHTYYNLAFAVTMAIEQMPELNQTGLRFFSYLPLCHIAERMLVEMGALYTGGTVSFAESLELFARNLQDTQPDVFLAVPRIWTKFQQGILAKIPERRLQLLLRLPWLNNIIKQKIKRSLGLSQARYVLTGAAPIPVSLLQWFERLDIHIQEAYAMTENCAYSHISLPESTRHGYVGKALLHNQVRLSDEGEIQVKSPCILNGYYKNLALTLDTITPDGYLKTGDKGEVTPDGYLRLTGRIKEIFKTAKGKYVVPSPIELRLSANTLVEQVCVTGAHLPQPLALVVLSDQARTLNKAEVTASIQQTLDSVNQQLDPHERLCTCVLVCDTWTTDNGILTPSLKIKRQELDQRYAHLYQQWHDERKPVVWQ